MNIRIKDICRFGKKSDIKAGEGNTKGKYMFFTSSIDKDKRIDKFDYDEEGIIMGTGGNATLHYYSGKFTVSTDCLVLLPNSSYKCKYLYYFFLHNMRVLEGGFRGAGLKHTSKSYIENIELTKTHSLLEQDKIISVLSNIDNTIVLQNKRLKLLNELTRSLFIEMFGDIHNNKNYDYTNIEEITSVLSGGTPDRKENKYWEGGTINWVKTTELNNNIIIETEEKITNLGLENSSAKIIPPQSILIAMYGQGKTRGMTGYLEVSSATNQACACILPSRYINQKYLWNYLILSYDKLRSMAKGGNQPNLNVMIIKKFPVLIPPMNLQEKFVQSVSSIDKSKYSSFSHLSA